MIYLLDLFFYNYGKVDVTMEIRTAAEKQQWRLKLVAWLHNNNTNFCVLPYIRGLYDLFLIFLCF